MGKVVVEVSVSVDGYATGPEVGVEYPMGRGGEDLHRWLGMDGVETGPADREIAANVFATAGAVLLGRRMFDLGIVHWGDDGAFGVPVVVVTHRERAELAKGPTTFTFVTDGVAAALERARAVAGERDVVVAGGADVVQQCLAAGVVDELRLHVAPMLLGAGTRLFEGPGAGAVELERIGAVTTPLATHLTFRPVR